MASGTADLQRDLGGAVMTSVLGTLLTLGYASAMGQAIDQSGKNVTDATQAQLQLSFASAEDLAKQNPQYASQITAAAKTVVPRRRRLGLRRRHGRDRRGDGARLLLLPAARSARRSCAPATTPSDEQAAAQAASA